MRRELFFVVFRLSNCHLSNSPSETSSRRRLSYRPFNMCLRTRALSRRSEVTSPREVGTKRRLQKSNYVLHRPTSLPPILGRGCPFSAFAVGRVTARRSLIQHMPVGFGRCTFRLPLCPTAMLALASMTCVVNDKSSHCPDCTLSHHAPCEV